MILSDYIAKGRAVVKSWWFAPMLAVLLILFLVRAWGMTGRDLDSATRRAEAAELRLKDLAVANEASERSLKAELTRMALEHVDLMAEIRRLQMASPGVKPTAVVHGSTGPVVVPPQTPPQTPSGPVCPQVPAPPDCVLRPGDAGEVTAAIATFETRAGNAVAVGAAEAWRVDPPPRTKLFGGPLRLEFTVKEQKPPPRWGAGAGIWAGRWGWAVGPVVAFPPARLWSTQVEVVAGAGVGSGGEWSGGATTVLRW